MLIARAIFPPTGTRQTKEVTILNYVRPFVCLCSSASLVLQYGGFVPSEWLVVKGLFVAYYYDYLFTLYS